MPKEPLPEVPYIPFKGTQGGGGGGNRPSHSFSTEIAGRGWPYKAPKGPLRQPWAGDQGQVILMLFFLGDS